MASKRNANTDSTPNPFANPDTPNGPFQSRTNPPFPMTPVSQDMALMIAEVNERRTRILELEAQVRAEQEGRRSDQEGRRADVERLTNREGDIRQESHKETVKLLRELMDAKMTIARLETELRLRTEPSPEKPEPRPDTKPD